MTRLKLLTALAIAGVGCAHAQSAAPTETLAQREYWAGQMDYTQRTLDSIESTCGGRIAFAYDRASWWPHKDALAARATSPNGRCDDVLNALVNICYGDPEAARVVLANVKSVECGYGGINTGFKLQLEAGKLRYDVEVERHNVGEEIANWLKDRM